MDLHFAIARINCYPLDPFDVLLMYNSNMSFVNYDNKSTSRVYLQLCLDYYITYNWIVVIVSPIIL